MDYNTNSEGNFESIARIPANWMWHADALKRSADLVRDQILEGIRLLQQQEPYESHKYAGLTPVYMLLAGLCIENSIKGLCIKSDPSIVNNGKISWTGSGHTLPALFTRARISLDSQEQQLVSRLAEFILWAGRYPSPLRATDYAKRDESTPPSIDIPSDFDMIDSLFKKNCELC